MRSSAEHRKGSLLFKTQNGARVGDAFVSLIYTCRLQGVDPFECLNALQRHAPAVEAEPQDRMPWSYRQTLAQLGPGPQNVSPEPAR